MTGIYISLPACIAGEPEKLFANQKIIIIFEK